MQRILSRLKGDVIAYRSFFAKKIIKTKIKPRIIKNKDTDIEITQNINYDIRFGVVGAIYLQQLLYWSDKGKREDGFIYKTKDEIYDETGITPKEQDTIRKQLIELKCLEVKTIKANGSPTLHYRLNLANVENFFFEKEADSIPDNYTYGQANATPRHTQVSDTGSYSLTENTQETTTKTTTYSVSPRSTGKSIKNKPKLDLKHPQEVNDLVLYFYAKICPGASPVFSPTNRKVFDGMLNTFPLLEIKSKIDKLARIRSHRFSPQALTPTSFSLKFGAISDYSEPITYTAPVKPAARTFSTPDYHDPLDDF